MNKQNLLIGVIIATLTATAYAAKVNQREESVGKTKSVAWYTANLPEARSKNKQCFDSPSLKGSEDCVNSLHALEISYKSI